MSGRTALVTGAGSGIGRETALALAERGVDVAVNDLYKERAEETARLVAAQGRKAAAVPGDVSRPDDVARMVDQALSALGRIDILVNNAGFITAVPFAEMAFKEWDRMFAVHVDGAFHCTQRAVAGMMERQWGRIINISSIAALSGGGRSVVHYAAAKAALIGFTKSLARELAPYNITVNAIAPGAIDTPMTAAMNPKFVEVMVRATPLRRLGTPRDIAAAVVYLASEDAGFVTGQVLSPNGGQYI